MAKEASSSTGGTVGALVGAASGAASAFGLPMGVGGSLSYSYEDGFTGNLSYGKAIGNLKLGGSINFAEGQGITGYGLNTGMGTGKGPFDQTGPEFELSG